MPAINLADDWYKHFGNRPAPKQRPEQSSTTSVPEPIRSSQGHQLADLPTAKKVTKKPIVEEDEEELDIVVDKKPAPKKKVKVTEEDWQMSAELNNGGESNITTRPRKNRKTAPAILGNKTYVSNGTALWAQVRKNAYPMYAQFCKNNNHIPNLSDYTKLISITWKSLSPEDKVKAATNPAEYFVFE